MVFHVASGSADVNLKRRTVSSVSALVLEVAAACSTFPLKAARHFPQAVGAEMTDGLGQPNCCLVQSGGPWKGGNQAPTVQNKSNWRMRLSVKQEFHAH